MKTNARNIGLILASLAIFVSCSLAQKDKTVVNTRTTGNGVAPAPTSASSQDAVQTAQTPEGIFAGFSLGLPSFCAVVTGTDASQSCLECKPRELSLRKCVAASAIDAAKDCGFKEDEVRCRLTELTYFILKVSETQEERFMKDFPMVISIVKAIVDAKMIKDRPESALVLTALDFLDQNSEAILAGTTPEVTAKALVDSLALSNPALTEEIKTKIQTAAVQILSTVSVVRKAEKLDQKASAALVLGVLAALPEGTATAITDKYPVDTVVAMLAKVKTDGLGILASLID